MISRRSFLSAAPAGLTGSALPTTAEGHGTGSFLLGRWMISSADLHIKDERTAFFRDFAHESPQLKFPSGFPQRGDAVRVNVNWDGCRSRGKNKHRPVVKMVLRVKPIGALDTDAEVRLIQTEPGLLDDERFKPLYAVGLHLSNQDWCGVTRWLIRVTSETKALAEEARWKPAAERVWCPQHEYQEVEPGFDRCRFCIEEEKVKIASMPPPVRADSRVEGGSDQ